MRCNAGPVTDTNVLVEQEIREARNLRVTQPTAALCNVISLKKKKVM